MGFETLRWKRVKSLKFVFLKEEIEKLRVGKGV